MQVSQVTVIEGHHATLVVMYGAPANRLYKAHSLSINSRREGAQNRGFCGSCVDVWTKRLGQCGLSESRS